MRELSLYSLRAHTHRHQAHLKFQFQHNQELNGYQEALNGYPQALNGYQEMRNLWFVQPKGGQHSQKIKLHCDALQALSLHHAEKT